METIKQNGKMRLDDRFKSYYVVWKRKCPHPQLQKNSSLNRTMQYGNRRGMHMTGWKFKSLNRTMQYGNHSVSQAYPLDEICLNRTMQYGNGKCI